MGMPDFHHRDDSGFPAASDALMPAISPPRRWLGIDERFFEVVLQPQRGIVE